MCKFELSKGSYWHMKHKYQEAQITLLEKHALKLKFISETKTENVIFENITEDKIPQGS